MCFPYSWTTITSFLKLWHWWKTNIMTGKYKSVFTREQIWNCTWRIVIAIFELPSIHTRERRLLWVCGLAFQSKEEEAWLISVLFWHADFYFISIRKCAVYMYQRKRLEGHVASHPKSQFRGQGIHTAFLLRDLRDMSLENTSGPSFELHNSNYANLRTHRPKYSHSNDP